MIFNTAGTAAGIDADLTVEGNTSRIFVVPGVPKEMKIMFERDVFPACGEIGGGAVILSRTLHTFGLGESAIAEMLGPLMKRDRNPSVGTTVANGIVSLRVNARFDSMDLATDAMERTVGECRAALGDLIFGADDETLPQVVGQLLEADPLARQQRPALATAESCTGGLLGKMLTDIAGSSNYYREGFITYSNEAKTELLGVPAELIATHGAVSEPVALAMAAGAASARGCRMPCRSPASPAPAAGCRRSRSARYGLECRSGVRGASHLPHVPPRRRPRDDPRPGGEDGADDAPVSPAGKSDAVLMNRSRAGRGWTAAIPADFFECRCALAEFLDPMLIRQPIAPSITMVIFCTCDRPFASKFRRCPGTGLVLCSPDGAAWPIKSADGVAGQRTGRLASDGPRSAEPQGVADGVGPQRARGAAI